MAINTQNIRVDLNPGKPIPVAYAHQNDNNREFTFTLYNNGVAYTPSGTTAKFGYKSPIVNGQYSVIAGNSMATGTVSGNTVTVTLPNTYTQVHGVGLLTMILTTSGNTLRPVNIKFVVQSSADGDDVVLGASDWPAGLYDYMDNWLEENEPTEIANLKSDIDYIAYEKTAQDFIDLSCINTNVSVGSVVNITPVSSASVEHTIQSCNQGDRFLLTGKGGTNPRLWAFLDGDYKLISKSLADAVEDSLILIAPSDGYIVVNVLRAIPSSFYKLSPSNVQTELDAINSKTTIKNNIEYNDWIENFCINSNVTVGSAVNMTPASGSSFLYQVIEVEKNKIYEVSAKGGNNPRAWAFTDSNYILLSKSASEISVDHVELTAPANGYLIVNSLKVSPYGYYIGEQAWITTKEKFELVDNEISDLQSDIIELENTNTNVSYHRPLVKFAIDHDLKNVSSLVSQFDFSDVDDLLFQVYDLFDGLVTQYPSYVTRYDAANYDGLSLTYPRYANGIAEGDSTYLPTQAYKTYLYKLSDINIGAGNNRNCPKKKIFIVCGTHGSENASPFNAYIFAKNLCESTDENYFKLRDAFDIYIIPWLNGYCAQHTSTNPRVNANGVNINRNFPVKAWQKMNEGTPNYTGDSAGSEFETQLVMALTEKIAPDMCIDHHNYFDGDYQFYTVIGSPKHLNLVYEALADCSFAFIKNLPSYFGTSYQLFVPNSDIENSPNRASGTNGTTCRWWYEQGIKLDATIEICANIRFQNGQASSARLDPYGNDTFSVAEYTLRNQILIYGQWVLDQLT